MDFNFRQYDPQIGRFLGVDPLADFGGQDRYSPYAAMGNMPESTIDPDGLILRMPNPPGYGIKVEQASNDGGGSAGGLAGGALGGVVGNPIWGDGTGGILDPNNLGMGAGLVASANAALNRQDQNQITGQTSNANKGADVKNNNASNVNKSGRGGSPEPNPQVVPITGIDVYFKADADLTTSKQPDNFCGIVTLVAASQQLEGSKVSASDIWLYVQESLNVQVETDGLSGKEMIKTANYFFKTESFTSYKAAIDKGRPVVAWYPSGDGVSNHFVLVIGYNTQSNSLIYLNSLTGNAERRDVSSFLTDIRIPLKCNK